MRKFKNLFFIIVICLFLMGCDASPFYSVMTGSEGIVTQNGKIVGEPKKPGLHFKIPFIQRVHMVELFRVRFLNLPVKNIDSLEAKLMWTVQNSKDFFIASQKGSIANILNPVSRQNSMKFCLNMI